jgi:hypothetical protein
LLWFRHLQARSHRSLFSLRWKPLWPLPLGESATFLGLLLLECRAIRCLRHRCGKWMPYLSRWRWLLVLPLCCGRESASGSWSDLHWDRPFSNIPRNSIALAWRSRGNSVVWIYLNGIMTASILLRRSGIRLIVALRCTGRAVATARHVSECWRNFISKALELTRWRLNSVQLQQLLLFRGETAGISRLWPRDLEGIQEKVHRTTCFSPFQGISKCRKLKLSKSQPNHASAILCLYHVPEFLV